VFETTDELTAAMARGDEKAVEAFYRRYFGWLHAQARRASRRDESFCLDVVQDAVLRVIRTVRPVGSEGQFRAWLRLVIQTTAWDRLRAEQRRQRHETIAISVRPSAKDTIDDDHDQLKKQIARLDPRLLEIIELRFEQRWTLNRIASKLGLSISTIDRRLRRALKSIRDRATEEFDE
jgi:RNA polymerase sigma factor (sigma-70 family)